MAGDQKAGQKGGKSAVWASLPVEISRIDWRDYNGRMTQGRRIGVSGIKILQSMRKGVSVGLECGEVFGAPEAVEQSLPVFEVDAIILDPRVEGAFQAVFAQVLAGQHPEGLVEGIAIDGPQRTQLRDGVDVALVLIEHPHELLLTDAQTAEHEQPFVPVLADVAENGLGEVLDHVLGLGLLAPLAVLVLLGVAVLGLLGRTADFAAKVHFFERFGVGGGIVGLLDDLDAVVGLYWGS